jgi:hypothetical protein
MLPLWHIPITAAIITQHNSQQLTNTLAAGTPCCRQSESFRSLRCQVIIVCSQASMPRISYPVMVPCISLSTSLPEGGEATGHGSYFAGKPELSLKSCTDVLDPTRNSTYDFLAEFLQEMTTVFEDPLIMLGGDEVGFDPRCKYIEPDGTPDRVCGYHCFDKDPGVARWMRQQGINSTAILDYFWKQITARVVPKLSGKTVGVWMADRPNGAGGPHHVWPPPHMSTLPPASVANVYQSMSTAAPLLDRGVPVVLSVAGSDWYHLRNIIIRTGILN